MEDFVPFELAKKLREKGFRELCTHFYKNKILIPQEMFCGLRSNTHHKWSFNSINVKLKDTHEQVEVNIVDAPTISQVLKWLREEKNIFVVTFIADDSDTPLTYEIYMGTECLLTHHGKYFTLQEWNKCNLVGIDYVIDNNFI